MKDFHRTMEYTNPKRTFSFSVIETSSMPPPLFQNEGNHQKNAACEVPDWIIADTVRRL